jgi:hypothetical protein
MVTKEQIKGKSTGEGIWKYFQNISAERKNGIFVLKTKEGKEIQILFFDGKIVYAESDVKNRDRAILTFLVECGIIDNETKSKILKRKEKAKGLSIISLLLEEKPGMEGEIAKCLKTRTFEIIIELLMSQEINFEFVEKGKGEIGFNPKIFRPTIPDSIIFDATRIIDELKNISEEAKVPRHIPVLTGSVDENTLERLRIDEKELIKYIDGKNAIIEIARKAKISVYEAMIYISELLRNGLAEIEGVKEFPAEEEEEKKRDVIKLGFKNLNAILIILALLIFYSASFFYPKKEKIKVLDSLQEAQVQKQMVKIQTALEAYRTMEGKYPDSLLSLSEKGIIDRKDLTFPINRLYYYKNGENGTYYELGL